MKTNALIIYGGGLADPAKDTMLRIARNLWELNVYDGILLGAYSFMSLYDQMLWEDYVYGETERTYKNYRGTVFGTCRGIDMTDPQLMKKAIETLRKYEIQTVIVCGGDGSSRNCAEISEEFEKNGINIIFAVPMTVDGINGGLSIGIDQAVREAVRQIENIVATSLETKDNGEYSVVAVELQGRNRDDILAKVLQHFWRQCYIADCDFSDIMLRVVPANYESNQEELLKEINTSKQRTLILVSEGAKLKVTELQNYTQRKVRTVIVGHAVQSNGQTTEADMEKYSEWLADIAALICEAPFNSYCIVNDGISRWREPIDYYAKLNPRKAQKAELSKGLEELIKDYMV